MMEALKITFTEASHFHCAEDDAGTSFALIENIGSRPLYTLFGAQDKYYYISPNGNTAYVIVWVYWTRTFRVFKVHRNGQVEISKLYEGIGRGIFEKNGEIYVRYHWGEKIYYQKKWESVLSPEQSLSPSLKLFFEKKIRSNTLFCDIFLEDKRKNYCEHLLSFTGKKNLLFEFDDAFFKVVDYAHEFLEDSHLKGRYTNLAKDKPQFFVSAFTKHATMTQSPFYKGRFKHLYKKNNRAWIQYTDLNGIEHDEELVY